MGGKGGEGSVVESKKILRIDPGQNTRKKTQNNRTQSENERNQSVPVKTQQTLNKTEERWTEPGLVAFCGQKTYQKYCLTPAVRIIRR